MNTDRKVLYMAAALWPVALLLLLPVPRQYVYIIAAALSAAAAVVISVFVSKRSIYAIVKRQVLGLMAVMGILYLVLYYLTGTEYGFSRRTVTPALLLMQALPIAVIIITHEIIRSILLAGRSRGADVLCYIASLLGELVIAGGLAGHMSQSRMVDLVALVLFPAVTGNLLYHYLARRYGPWPGVVWRLITVLHASLLPVYPTVPHALLAFANVLLPMAVYAFISLLYEKKKKRATAQGKGVVGYVAMALVLLLMISTVMMISCQFRFGALVIATGSMTGEINKGDVAIYEAYDGQIVSEGQVIVFTNYGRKTVHRVVDVQRVNGQLRYYTKGDANPAWDSGYITQADINGLVRCRVAYVGYPTLWLRQIFR